MSFLSKFIFHIAFKRHLCTISGYYFHIWCLHSVSKFSDKTREKRNYFAAKMKLDFSTGEFKSRKKDLGKHCPNMLINI